MKNTSRHHTSSRVYGDDVTKFEVVKNTEKIITFCIAVTAISYSNEPPSSKILVGYRCNGSRTTKTFLRHFLERVNAPKASRSFFDGWSRFHRFVALRIERTNVWNPASFVAFTKFFESNRFPHWLTSQAMVSLHSITFCSHGTV